MKVFGSLFWAIILVLVGVLIILKESFGWQISIFSIVFAVILILLGIAILTKPSGSGFNKVFANGKVQKLKNGEASYIFSNVTVDLSECDSNKVEINCIFSNVRVLTGGRSVRVTASGAFSSTILPDNTTLSFGDRVYERDGLNQINIETSCVFGEMIIE
jgi:hypothetical protein